MFGIADHIKNIDKDSAAYKKGVAAFQNGESLTTCTLNGTTWDQASWLAGWFDQLMREVVAQRYT